MHRTRHPGKLIAFEGLDGSGQTTQAKLLTRWLQQKAGLDAHYTKEPTGGPIGSILKRALADAKHTNAEEIYGKEGDAKDANTKDSKDTHPTTAPAPNPATLALLFAADRLDHLEREILPLLKRGTHVITDRYTLSSLAYQSVELDPKWVRSINRYALPPDLTIFLDVPLETCLERIRERTRNRTPQPELYENAATLQQVERRYRQMIRTLKQEGLRIETVDGTLPPHEVHANVVKTAKAFFRKALTRQREPRERIAPLVENRPFSAAEVETHLHTENR